MNSLTILSAVVTVVTAPPEQPTAQTVIRAGQAAYAAQHVTRAGAQEQAQGIVRDELRILQGHNDLNPPHRRIAP